MKGCRYVLALAAIFSLGTINRGAYHELIYIWVGAAVFMALMLILDRRAQKSAGQECEEAQKKAAERPAVKPVSPVSPVTRAPEEKKQEAPDKASEQRIRNEDFEIKNRALIKYKGNESHVTVPDGVERICTYAFTEIEKFMVWVGRPGDEGVVTHEIERPMDYVREVVLPDSVTHIEGRAFAWCENLESVRFGKNIRVIEKDAFCLCRKLKQVVIFKDTVIDIRAFEKETEIIRAPKQE